MLQAVGHYACGGALCFKRWGIMLVVGHYASSGEHYGSSGGALCLWWGIMVQAVGHYACGGALWFKW